jgi:hypothetical protein
LPRGWNLSGTSPAVGRTDHGYPLARVPITDANWPLKSLRAVERLNLEATEISDLGLSSLSRLTTLRGLNLSFNLFRRGLASLAPLVNLSGYRFGDTRSGYRVRTADGAEIASGAGLELEPDHRCSSAEHRKAARLGETEPQQSDVSDAGLINWPRCRTWSRSIPRGGRERYGLAEASRLRTLRSLNLSDGRFTDKGWGNQGASVWRAALRARARPTRVLPSSRRSKRCGRCGWFIQR